MLDFSKFQGYANRFTQRTRLAPLFLLLCGLALILLACGGEEGAEQPDGADRQPTATTERTTANATEEPEEDSPTPEATRGSIVARATDTPATSQECRLINDPPFGDHLSYGDMIEIVGQPSDFIADSRIAYKVSNRSPLNELHVEEMVLSHPGRFHWFNGLEMARFDTFPREIKDLSVDMYPGEEIGRRASAGDQELGRRWQDLDQECELVLGIFLYADPARDILLDREIIRVPLTPSNLLPTATPPAPTPAPTPTAAPPAPTAAPEPTGTATTAATRAPTAAPEPTPKPEPTATPKPTPTPQPRFTPLAPEKTSAETDREALIALFNATNGEEWDRTNSWLGRGAVGSWHGVSTDEYGRVIGLNLERLEGRLPPELGNLTSLQWLAVQQSRLEGGIPAGLDNLTSLEWLAMSGSQLDGEIPPELGSLPNLAFLGLSDNQLSGEIPQELENLPLLSEVAYQWGQTFPGMDPKDVSHVAGFANNDLSGCVSDYFAEYLDDTDYFRAWYNTVRLPKCPPPPDHPDDLAALIAIYDAWGQPGWENWLGRGSIADWEGVSVDSSGRVAALQARGSRMGQEISGRELPPELGNLTGLKVLDLSRVNFRGEIPPELGNLTKLKVLNLEGVRNRGQNLGQLSGQIPPQLCNLTNLKVLNLSRNQLTNYSSAFHEVIVEEGAQAALQRYLCR